MSSIIIKANFDLPPIVAEHNEPDDYRAKALESVSGSMVYCAGTPLFWDLLSEVK